MSAFKVSAEDRFAIVSLDFPDDLAPGFATVQRLAHAASRLEARWDFLWDLRHSSGEVYADILDAYDAAHDAGDAPWRVLAKPGAASAIAEAFTKGGRRPVRVVPMRKKSLKATPIDMRVFDHQPYDVFKTLDAYRDRVVSQHDRRVMLADYLRGPDQTAREAVTDLAITDDELRRLYAVEGESTEEFLDAVDSFDVEIRASRLEATLSHVVGHSMLVELAIQLSAGGVTVVPYHGASLHQVPTPSDDVVLVRPGRASKRYWQTFRGDLQQLEQLLSAPKVSERALEQLLLSNPLFLRGLNYSHIYPQVVLPRNGASHLRPDIIAEPVDSEWAHIVDLKLPSQRVLRGRDNRASLASGLAEAVSQLREYAAYFDDRQAARRVEDKYGFKCYKPKLTVIVGRDPTAFSDEERRRALTAHPDLEIVTYDRLLSAARSQLLL
jgi:hypothetical protein